MHARYAAELLVPCSFALAHDMNEKLHNLQSAMFSISNLEPNQILITIFVKIITLTNDKATDPAGQF